jgi:hypothetical protein
VATLVTREHNGRSWVSFADQSTLVDPKTHIQFQLIHASNGAYAVRIDTGNATILPPVLIPALYDCLNLAFGDASQAKKLGLYIPDMNAATPTYSPALGFYIVNQ